MKEIILTTGIPFSATFFSVLFAFYLNRRAERIRRRKVYCNLLEALRIELENNKGALEGEKIAPISFETFKLVVSNEVFIDHVLKEYGGKFVADFWALISDLRQFKSTYNAQYRPDDRFHKLQGRVEDILSRLKNKKSMSEQELSQQHDRVLEQVREEIRELYGIHKFFIVIDTGLFGLLFSRLDEIDFDHRFWFYLAGVVISSFWTWVAWKQLQWREHWIEKLQEIEKDGDAKSKMWVELNYESLYHWVCDFVFGKGKMMYVMWLLPLTFLVFWLLFLFGVVNIS